MLQRFHRWMRVILPVDWVVWLAVSVLLIGMSIPWVTRWYLLATAPDNIARELLALQLEEDVYHQRMVVLMAGLWGFARGVYFHPLGNSGYGKWLAQTPWRYPERVPFGAVGLVWQDAVLIAAMTLIALVPPHDSVNVLLVPGLYLLGYGVGSAWLVASCGIYWPLFSVVCLIGLGLFWITYPWVALLVAGIICLVAHAGIAVSLREFPYGQPQREALGLVPKARDSRPDVLWPLVPRSEEPRAFGAKPSVKLLAEQAAPLAATAGWVMFCIAYLGRQEPDMELVLSGAFYIVAWIAIGLRAMAYVIGHAPPISIAGRIATRRWVIPGYDQVFLAPIAAGLTAWWLPPLLLTAGVPALVTYPIATATVIYLAARLRPTWERWHYTGHYRVPETSLNRTNHMRA